MRRPNRDFNDYADLSGKHYESVNHYANYQLPE